MIFVDFHYRMLNFDRQLQNLAQKISLNHYPKEKQAMEVKYSTLTKSLKKKFLIDSSLGFSNDVHHAKINSISDEEGTSTIECYREFDLHYSGHPSRNHYAEINNLDSIGTTERLSNFNKPKPISSKRPPSSTIRKNVCSLKTNLFLQWICFFVLGEWFE